MISSVDKNSASDLKCERFSEKKKSSSTDREKEACEEGVKVKTGQDGDSNGSWTNSE